MPKRGMIWIATCVVLAVAFLRLSPMVAREGTLLGDYSMLIEVDALVRKNYVEPIPSDRLARWAIEGMMNGLDPYSGFITPEKREAFERHTSGETIGTGIDFDLRDGRWVVSAAIEGSSAAQAGVLPGDEILAIAGTDVAEHSFIQIQKRLLGAEGTLVRVTLRRADHPGPIELALRLSAVTHTTVRGFGGSPDRGSLHVINADLKIGYIRVSAFRRTTIADFNVALDEVIAQGVDALVLDLRFNPGGLMTQGIAMIDRFVEKGLILSTINRRGGIEEFHATAEGTIMGLPMVVLVNGGSGSAAEIVSGSLQDHKRATIIGENTFGKGSVQHLIPLHSGRGALKLTVAYYRLPSGRIIHRGSAPGARGGVYPDVEVASTARQRREIITARRVLDGAGASSDQTTTLPIDAQLRAALQHLGAKP